MTSRDRILNAAIPIFARKGRHGAHMEEIASLAHINKAMIYYIFHNKDDLYLEVLKFVFNEAASSFSNTQSKELNNKNDYIEFITEFIKDKVEFYDTNRVYNKIIADAMSNGVEEIPLAIQSFKDNNNNKSITSQLEEVIKKGITEGFFREIDVDQFIINIIGLITIYFQLQSMTLAFDIDVGDEKVFLEKRKKSIIDLIINSIVLDNNKN